MSWFVGKKTLNRSGKYLVTQAISDKIGPNAENPDPLHDCVITSKCVSKPHDTTPVRRDSVAETVSRDRPSQVEYDCDLSTERDVTELIDAVKKLLRLTDLDVAQQRLITSELIAALGFIVPRTRSTMDKSLLVSAVLRQANNLSLPDDISTIVPLVRKLIAILEL